MKTSVTRFCFGVAVAVFRSRVHEPSTPAHPVLTAEARKDFEQALSLLKRAETEIPGNGAHGDKEKCLQDLRKAKDLLGRVAHQESMVVDQLNSEGKRESAECTATAQVAMSSAFANDSLTFIIAEGEKGTVEGGRVAQEREYS